MALREGFFKVNQDGGCFVMATFYNPRTKESYSECVRDYDYADCSRDNDELYCMPINIEAKRAWLHNNGQILDGDIVEVIKGRKVRVGTVGTVVKIKEIKNRYGIWVADYAVLSTGDSTNVTNCRLIEAV